MVHNKSCQQNSGETEEWEYHKRSRQNNKIIFAHVLLIWSLGSVARKSPQKSKVLRWSSLVDDASRCLRLFVTMSVRKHVSWFHVQECHGLVPRQGQLERPSSVGVRWGLLCKYTRTFYHQSLVTYSLTPTSSPPGPGLWYNYDIPEAAYRVDTSQRKCWQSFPLSTYSIIPVSPCSWLDYFVWNTTWTTQNSSLVTSHNVLYACVISLNITAPIPISNSLQ